MYLCESFCYSLFLEVIIYENLRAFRTFSQRLFSEQIILNLCLFQSPTQVSSDRMRFENTGRSLQIGFLTAKIASWILSRIKEPNSAHCCSIFALFRCCSFSCSKAEGNALKCFSFRYLQDTRAFFRGICLLIMSSHGRYFYADAFFITNFNTRIRKGTYLGKFTRFRIYYKENSNRDK